MVEKMSRADRNAPQQPVGEAAAWTVLSYLLTGPALYGGLGWLLDKWLGTTFFIVVGLLGGMALSIYVIYRRYVYVSPPGAPATLPTENIVAGGPVRTNRSGSGKLSRNQASSSQLRDTKPNNPLAEHQPVGPSAETRIEAGTVIEPDEPIKSTDRSATGTPGGEPTDPPSDP